MKFYKRHSTIKQSHFNEMLKKMKQNFKNKNSINFNNNSNNNNNNKNNINNNNNKNNNNNEIEKLDIKKEKFNFEIELDLKKNKPLTTKRIVKIIYKNLYNYNKNLTERYDIMIINNLLRKKTLINNIYNELLLNIDECDFIEKEFNLIESKNKIKFLGIINNHLVKFYPNYLKFPENYLNLIIKYLNKKQKLIKFFENKKIENKKNKNNNENSNYSFIKNLSISSLKDGNYNNNNESDDFFDINYNNKNNEIEKQEEKSFQNIQKLIKIIEKNLKKRQKKIDKKRNSLTIFNIKNEDEFLELEYLNKNNKNNQISSDSSSENENNEKISQRKKVKKFHTTIVNHTNPKKMENILNKIIIIKKTLKNKTKNKSKKTRNKENLNSIFKTEINDRTKKIFAKTSKFILKSRNDNKNMFYYQNSIKNYFQNLPNQLISDTIYKPLIFNKKTYSSDKTKNNKNNNNKNNDNNNIFNIFSNKKLKVVYSYTKINSPQPHYSIEKNKKTKQLLINTEGYSTEMTTTKNLSSNVIYNIKKTYHLLNKQKQKSLDFSNSNNPNFNGFNHNINNKNISNLFFYNSMFNSDNNRKFYLNERRKRYEIERNYETNLKKFPYKNNININSKYININDHKSLTTNNNNNNIKSISKYNKRPSNFSEDKTMNTQNSQSILSNKTSIVKNIKFFVPNKRKAQSSYGRYNNFHLSSNNRRQFSISGFGALKIYGFN